jgi:hypothetical protein
MASRNEVLTAGFFAAITVAFMLCCVDTVCRSRTLELVRGLVGELFGFLGSIVR